MNEKDKALALQVVREIDAAFESSERLRLGRWVLPNEREETLASFIAKAFVAVRQEVREEAFTAIGVEMRKYGANIRKVDLLARFQELYRELEAAAEPPQPTGEQEENDRLWCGGCLRYLDDEHPCVCKPAAPPPTTPSDAAMRAAEEIRTQFKARFVIPSEDTLAAIITRHLPATVSSASVDREAAAKMAFDTVKAVLESNNQYSALQVAAMAAANIRYLVPPLSACVNCGHSDLHDGPAGTVDDACTHEGCNCGYYTPSDQVAGIGYREAAAATTSPETGWTPEEYRAKFCSETPVGGEAKKCVKCGHSNFNRVQSECDEPDDENIFCGCKCEFTAPVVATGDDEGDAARVERLSAQLKGVMNCLAISQREVERLRAGQPAETTATNVGYCSVCRSTHVLTANNCRAMDGIA